IRDRSASLQGRCGSCEFQGVCGGCRARAYGVHGDYMAEDPLCSYQPGRHERKAVEAAVNLVYGASVERQVEWDAEAEERISRVPSFVRGMVIQAVERHCRQNGIERVSVEALDLIRSRMPTGRIFARAKEHLD